MNLQETVNYQQEVFGIVRHPVFDMLKVDSSMLNDVGRLTYYSKISTAKNLLLCFDAECMHSSSLRNALHKTSLFVADIAELARISGFSHSRHDILVQRLHCFDDGMSWLQAAGMCSIVKEIDSVEYDVRLLDAGKGAVRLLKLEKEFCDAADFLTTAGASKYMSETEEQLNCVLAGHKEWIEDSWLKQQLQWLHAVEALGKNGYLGTRLTKMLVQLQLVKSWQSQIASWIEQRNNVDFLKVKQNS